MIDVDHFKDVNDTYGHGVGDQVLRAIGQVATRTCRPYDTACRFGGDEFAVVYSQVEGDVALRAANRLIAPTRSRPRRSSEKTKNSLPRMRKSK